jgi:hypothetical protein
VAHDRVDTALGAPEGSGKLVQGTPADDDAPAAGQARDTDPGESE